MPELAAIHEFGAPGANIPARPFMRRAADAHQHEWTEVARKEAALMVGAKAGQTAQVVARAVAVRMDRDLKLSITSNTPPPLRPSTIERKGSSKTLIDTGALRDAIEHRVRRA